MGSYERLPDHPVDEPERRTHNRTRMYQVRVPLDDRNTLAHTFRSVLNDKWAAQEHNIDYDRGVLTLRVGYGPVHGNYPSDVKRAIRNAGVDVLGDVIVIDTKHVDTTEHVCRHMRCSPPNVENEAA